MFGGVLKQIGVYVTPHAEMSLHLMPQRGRRWVLDGEFLVFLPEATLPGTFLLFPEKEQGGAS